MQNLGDHTFSEILINYEFSTPTYICKKESSQDTNSVGGVLQLGFNFWKKHLILNFVPDFVFYDDPTLSVMFYITTCSFYKVTRNLPGTPFPLCVFREN